MERAIKDLAMPPIADQAISDAFSGRVYVETPITSFITKHNLPCNATTAFLTPALRNIKQTLTTEVDRVGSPRKVYSAALQQQKRTRAIPSA